MAIKLAVQRPAEGEAQLLLLQGPFLLFFASVMFSAWYGGLKPGLFATALSAVLIDLILLPPPHRPLQNAADDNLRLALFIGEAGIISMLLGSLHTATWRAEQNRNALAAAARRAEFLGDAAVVLSSSLDYEETLAALTRQAVPFVADWCSADVLDPDGSIRRLAVAQADPSKNEIALAAATYPPDPDGLHPRTQVLRTGQSILIEEVTDDGLVRMASNEAHLRSLRALGYRSAMIVPLTARGEILGALTFATAESGRHYGRDDLALAEELARRAALAVDNARLYRAAQQANRMKDHFLATISHELRTPLQAMLGWVAVLRQGTLSPDRQARALDILDRAGKAQAKLIEDLLDVSRIVTGRLRLEIQPVDLIPIIEEAVDDVRPAAEAKNVHLDVILDRSIAPLAADPDRLQQVMSNLLANAVRFAADGGRAEIRVESAGDDVRITVGNDGDGIHPDFLPQIFEPFAQAEPAARQGHGGLGLGLAIVRRLVELHGGQVEAKSEGAGRGAQFVVTLPSAPLAMTARAAP